jgi:hypothetical protein
MRMVEGVYQKYECLPAYLLPGGGLRKWAMTLPWGFAKQSSEQTAWPWPCWDVNYSQTASFQCKTTARMHLTLYNTYSPTASRESWIEAHPLVLAAERGQFHVGYLWVYLLVFAGKPGHHCGQKWRGVLLGPLRPCIMFSGPCSRNVLLQRLVTTT